ncbi:glycosyltransferase [Ravibacter arvi]|uniref:Glycosyltransferase n=1 Tax=Ravibacter arvi TaxID=2051041 RepID=A0ABP8LP72_9BACT
MVTVAAHENGAVLLQKNFPELRILPLAGYEIRYGSSRATFTARIVLQIPKILAAIRRENHWLRRTLAAEPFDVVISDNRYGLYHPVPYSVILTHQLRIITGLGGVADRLLQRLHYRLLNRFDACWVVDGKEWPDLGGALSHPAQKPKNPQYIGPLSQFEAGNSGHEAVPGKILFLLSGPEPMRGLLENKLIVQASRLPSYRFVMVAGSVGQQKPAVVPPNMTYHAWLEAKALQAEIESCELVVCRSGYSTLMDLWVLGKKALLVPTPGQSEQEYLAKNLQDQAVFPVRQQEDLNLETDIPSALQFQGFGAREKRLEAPAFQAVTDILLEKLSAPAPGFRQM